MKKCIPILLVLLLIAGCGPEDESPSGTSDNGQTKFSFPIISHGEEVTLAKHVASGKFTVFKFTADW